MKKRLIDANTLIQDVEKLLYKWNPIVAFIQKQVDKQPAIDAMPKWIPCEERLPECKTVLVTCNSDIEFGIYRKARNEWAIWEDSRWVWGVDVTAWMPLPEPYVGERKDDDGQR